MSAFGWSLPPGCSMRDIDPPELPCEVCGVDVDSCICPECPVCQTNGDPICYEAHGLTRTPEQIAGRERLEQHWKDEAAADAAIVNMLDIQGW